MPKDPRETKMTLEQRVKFLECQVDIIQHTDMQFRNDITETLKNMQKLNRLQSLAVKEAIKKLEDLINDDVTKS